MAQLRPIPTADVPELAKRLLLARAGPADDDAASPRGRAVFWVGAGMSVSAGIPSGRRLAGHLAVWLAMRLGIPYDRSGDERVQHDAAFTALQQAGEIDGRLTLASAYGELFAKLDPTQQRSFVRRVIERTNRRQVNWAHLALAELVRMRVVHTVLTTNFDDLLLDGLVRCDQLPAIVDGVEALNRLDPRPPVPQLVYLHGSQHTYSPRNSTQAVQNVRDRTEAHGGLFSLLQQCSVLTVVGYGGNPGEGVMELLMKVCAALPELPVYWVAHNGQDDLSGPCRELLCACSAGRLIAEQDADLFFRDLLRQMRIGVPAWFRNPVAHLLDMAQRIAPSARQEAQALNQEIQDFRERLVLLSPLWEHTGTRTQEARELRQLMLQDAFDKVWDRLADRELDDMDLLEMRAEAACVLSQRGTHHLLPQAVRDFAKVLRALPTGTPRWALRQMRLADALALMGERGDTRAIHDAIAAYGRALPLYSRETDRTTWARIREHQGIAWLTLAEGGDVQALDQATQAFRDSLEVISPAREPFQWSGLKTALGNALQVRGRLAKDRALLEAAIREYREALEILGDASHPVARATTQCNLATALLELGQMGDAQSLLDSIAMLRATLSALDPERHLVERLEVENNLGVALLTHARSGDRAALFEAIDVLTAALTRRLQNDAPLHWAVTSQSLGHALVALSGLDGGARLDEALREFERVRAALSAEHGLLAPSDGVASLAGQLIDTLSSLAQGDRASGTRRPGGQTRPSSSSTKVLVVEDDEPQQHVIVAMLRSCMPGVDTRVCGNGEEALQQLGTFAPDLVILDVRLPGGMDGREVLAAIRRRHARLPVLIYTSDQDVVRQLTSTLDPYAETTLVVLEKVRDQTRFLQLVPSLFKRRSTDGEAQPPWQVHFEPG